MTQWQTLKPHTRVYLVALSIFVLGSIGGTLIYLLNGSAANGSNFQIIGGQVYATDVSNSKAYNDQLERMGGRSAVFADQFSRWLGGLWHGERLGITVVVLATITTLVLLWVARQMERDYIYRASRKIEASQS